MFPNVYLNTYSTKPRIFSVFVWPYSDTFIIEINWTHRHTAVISPCGHWRAAPLGSSGPLFQISSLKAYWLSYRRSSLNVSDGVWLCMDKNDDHASDFKTDLVDSDQGLKCSTSSSIFQFLLLQDFGNFIMITKIALLNYFTAFQRKQWYSNFWPKYSLR